MLAAFDHDAATILHLATAWSDFDQFTGVGRNLSRSVCSHIAIPFYKNSLFLSKNSYEHPLVLPQLMHR
jgi:hypothetical protein